MALSNLDDISILSFQSAALAIIRFNDIMRKRQENTMVDTATKNITHMEQSYTYCFSGYHKLHLLYLVFTWTRCSQNYSTVNCSIFYLFVFQECSLYMKLWRPEIS